MKMSEEFNVCKAIRMACGGNKEIFIEACGIAEVSREAITMSLKEFEFTEDGPKLKTKPGALTVYKDSFDVYDIRFEYSHTERTVETFLNGNSTHDCPVVEFEEAALLHYLRKAIDEIYADIIGAGNTESYIERDLRRRSKLALRAK